MKQLLIMLLILAASITATSAQTKKEIPPPKPKYEFFVKVSLEDFNSLYQAIQAYQRIVIYDESLTSDQKVQMQKNLLKYIPELGSRVKKDSTLLIGTQPIKKE